MANNRLRNGLDTFTTGSNYNFDDKVLIPDTPRSVFDLSHKHITTLPNCGLVPPVCFFEAVPSDSHQIGARALVRVNPQEVPLMSAQNLYMHGFYSRISDLWKDGQTFMTKGYSGNLILKIPTIRDFFYALKDMFNLSDADFNDYYNLIYVSHYPLFSYLGLPTHHVSMSGSTLVNDDYYFSDLADVSILPFMMYHRIWRDYYCNRNFYINNFCLFPNDDSDFRLNSSGMIQSFVDNKDNLPDMFASADLVIDWFFGLHYRDWGNDYFTSALPFPQRGDTPTLNYNLSGELPVRAVPPEHTGSIAFDNVPASFYPLKLSVNNLSPTPPGSLSSPYVDGVFGESGGYVKKENTLSSFLAGMINNSYSFVYGAPGSYTPLKLYANYSDLNLSVTLNQIRQLAIEQSELEKMARTNGSYQEFGLTFFNKIPKNSTNFQPIYIGGVYQQILFSEVLQTSESTNNSSLGQFAGHGIASLNGQLGSVDCDDFGFIMVTCSIMPDTYYFQGLDIKFTRSTQSDMFLPERARLGLRPVLNKELYFQGHFASSEVDDGLFAYQNPFDELRYIPNRISGKIANVEQLSFISYTQARILSSLPTFSQSFAVANDVRKDYLTAPVEDAYICDFSFDIRSVRPLPYNPVPAQII